MIAIYFDKNRQVQRLANYGLQDGKIFDFISRRPRRPSGQELNYLPPLFKLCPRSRPLIARTAQRRHEENPAARAAGLFLLSCTAPS